MSEQSNDPLAELQHAYEGGHISAATYSAMAGAYRTMNTDSGAVAPMGGLAAGERGVAIGSNVSDSTIITGDYAGTTSAGTYIENQTVFQTLAEPQHRPLQQLLAKITEVTMSFMMDIQFAHVQPTRERYTIMNDAYRVWEIESTAIKTQLRIQTQSAAIVKEWESFAFAVTRFYALAGTNQEQQASSQLAIHQTICQYLPIQQSRAVTWTNLRAGLLEWHDQIIETIMNTISSSIRIA
jgi:hypothetical protein